MTKIELNEDLHPYILMNTYEQKKKLLKQQQHNRS